MRIAALNRALPWFEVDRDSDGSQQALFLSQGFPYLVTVGRGKSSDWGVVQHTVTFGLVGDLNFSSFEEMQQAHRDGSFWAPRQEMVLNERAAWREAREEAESQVDDEVMKRAKEWWEDEGKSDAHNEAWDSWDETWSRKEAERWWRRDGEWEAREQVKRQFPLWSDEQIEEEVEFVHDREIEDKVEELRDEWIEEAVDASREQAMDDYASDIREEVLEELAQSNYDYLSETTPEHLMVEGDDLESPSESIDHGARKDSSAGSAFEVMATVVDIVKSFVLGDSEGWDLVGFSGDEDHAPVYRVISRRIGASLGADFVVAATDFRFTRFAVFRSLQEAVGSAGPAKILANEELIRGNLAKFEILYPSGVTSFADAVIASARQQGEADQVQPQPQKVPPETEPAAVTHPAELVVFQAEDSSMRFGHVPLPQDLQVVMVPSWAVLRMNELDRYVPQFVELETPPLPSGLNGYEVGRRGIARGHDYAKEHARAEVDRLVAGWWALTGYSEMIEAARQAFGDQAADEHLARARPAILRSAQKLLYSRVYESIVARVANNHWNQYAQSTAPAVSEVAPVASGRISAFGHHPRISALRSA
jgi:hypothetical protein